MATITKQIERIIEQEGMDYRVMGPASSLAVQYDRTARDWRIYDDYGDMHVASVEEAREEIRRWKEAMDA
jgi:hypothetical protein